MAQFHLNGVASNSARMAFWVETSLSVADRERNRLAVPEPGVLTSSLMALAEWGE
jgi:hypothetical protein